MKYLLCVQEFMDKNILKNHYIIYHKINAENHFFKAMFKKYNESFMLRKCYRCDEFITS